MPFARAESDARALESDLEADRETQPTSATLKGDSGTRPGRWRGDLAAVAIYVMAAIYVTVHLWASPGRYVNRGPGGVDLHFFEFAMAHGARVLTDLQNPLFTAQLNAPMGINMIGNTSVLGLSVPLTPVTLLFGPQISVLVALVICLAGTAAAWYFVLSRHLVSNRFGAFIAGAFCGFAPAMMSQAVGHLNFIAQFLIPIIGWRVIKLGESGRVVRNGVILGLLVIWQAFLNEEFLLFTAIGCLFWIATWALARRAEAKARLRAFISSLGIAAGIGVAGLAYPLYVQFMGPQSYEGLPFKPATFYADIYSFFLFAGESLAGDKARARYYAPNTSEQNTFLGWPLMLLLIVLVVWLWRSISARAAIVVALVFGAISVGREIMIARNPTGIPGPYRYLSHLPLIDMSMPSRYALMIVPMVAILIAIATERITLNGIRSWRPSRRLQYGWYGVLALALLPIAPTPLAVEPATPAPHFIATGGWREYVKDGGTLVPVPLAAGNPWAAPSLRWSAVAGLDFAAPGGYFIGPRGKDDRQARFNAPARTTATLLDSAALRNVVPWISFREREAALADLRFWNASVLVLGAHPSEDALRKTVESLLRRPAQRVDDVWVWDVRDLTR